METVLAGNSEVARRMRELDWLAMLSQELGTPLAAMRMWVDALETELGPLKAIVALRECLRDETRSVNDLLDMARAMTRRLRISLVPIDPASCVRAALDAVKPIAASKGVNVELSVEDAPPGIRADPARLRQIVDQLLSNAVKFTRRGGRVRVTLERADDGVELAVRDDGRGFSREFEPFLFAPFRQEEHGETRAGVGLGLGLALVRRLVQLHQGTVKAESAGLGRGATFTVWLPAAPRSSATRSETEPRALHARRGFAVPPPSPKEPGLPRR